MLLITSLNVMFLLAVWSFAAFGIAHDIDGLDIVDKRSILKFTDGGVPAHNCVDDVANTSIDMEAPALLDLKYIPRAEPLTVTVTETVCEFGTTTSVEGTITLSIPETSTAASTTETTTSQPTVGTPVPSATHTVPTTVSHATSSASSTDQTTTRRASSTGSSTVSSPASSGSQSPTAPPLSDVAAGQEKTHMVLLACGLVLAGILNV
ncbi:uncharacterized protein ACLA_039100 [Aspergillus clavatus NRRL 1]|uniref:GPI anchored protein n=1 Tax=Aspergillus clavatus (strain ATCC 1007 / CBS 513.65 / DSM 816 / NCTC 3887 / NRRL 1 / QM 1276 / 107) TaxID=344612 RepID=A1CKM1_ASPCL|nr:uncharacterized protein ACLA_039100 [Aspergillus clavatus NRRL 1]EAW09695.1 conserved hypothetical protein [Aspergillus clavatus NRRL 1]